MTSGFNKAIDSDLSSSVAATLTKETKTSMRQAQSVVNGENFQGIANGVADYVGGFIGGQANEIIDTSSPSVAQPNDATHVQRNSIYPLYQDKKR